MRNVNVCENNFCLLRRIINNIFSSTQNNYKTIATNFSSI